jgi:cytochrome c biogenesis protein CcdA
LRILPVLLLCCSVLLGAPTLTIVSDGNSDSMIPRAGDQLDLLVTVDPGTDGLAVKGLSFTAASEGGEFGSAILPPPDEEGVYGAPFLVRIPMNVIAGDSFAVTVTAKGTDGKGKAHAIESTEEIFALPALGGGGLMDPGFEEKTGILKLKGARFKTTPAKAGKRNTLVVQLELTGLDYHVYGTTADPKDGIKMAATLLPNGPERAWLDRGRIIPTGEKFHGTFEMELPITPIRVGKNETRLRLVWQACTNVFCEETKVAYAPISFDVVEGDGGPIEDPAGGYASGQAVDEKFASESIWLLFLAAIAAGLFALLMPCTYPLIPITISFFTKQAEARDGKVTGLALAYGGGIVAVFAGIGAVVGLTAVTDAHVTDFATNPWVNAVFALLFLVFGLSLVGLYEIRLPTWFDNVAMKAGTGGGYLSVFAMGTTLVITSFTCTAPFIGSLLAFASQSGDWLRVTACMAVFGLTMAIPFVFLSLSPKALQNLPRSGIWMKHLKVVLGIIELGLVLKFVSNIDLAIGKQIIGRETFLAIWGLSFLLSALYLMDLPALFSKSRVWTMSKGGAVSIILLLAITVFLYSGLNGALLKSSNLEAFLPPATEARYAKKFVAVVKEDYDEGVRIAGENNAPILLHFTGFQ